MAISLNDIHSDIIQTHILPKLDGPSLYTTATVSSYLQTLCSDHNLWSHISKSTWPSITDPRVHDVISTFPGGYRSFFQDSFPSLVTEVSHLTCRQSLSNKKQPSSSSCGIDKPANPAGPSELISAVDIRYKNDIIYSNVKFTDTTVDFLSSEIEIELSVEPNVNRFIDLTVDEFVGPDEGTLSHLKESLTIDWILIDPTLKRAVSLSSMKPISAKKDWTTNDYIRIQYTTILPGCDPNEMVQCKIVVVVEGVVGLHVEKVLLKLMDLKSNRVTGRDFLVITQRAILEENNVKRKVVTDEERWRSHYEFKEMQRHKREWERKEEEKMEFYVKMNNVGILVAFFICLYYFLILSLQ